MSISFSINQKIHTVKATDFPADITLNTYIREHAKLSGTKFMCLEGGCGACVVTIRKRHPVSHEYHGKATNSCLTMLHTCDGADIITIEGLGSKHEGYHPLQERLAHQGGSQCGYCSPGMVMNMYSLLEAKGGNVNATEVENSFGGNICRCTGYRPILDAMKSFATDSEYEYIDDCEDIEDLGKQCPRIGKTCPEICKIRKSNIVLDDGFIWYYPKNLLEIFAALHDLQDREYMLVAGNTAHGVYRRDETIRTFIDVNCVPELQANFIGSDLELGGNITLTEAMDILTQVAVRPGFEYCTKIVDHIDKIANVPVRNMGTIAGNLMTKHRYNEFPSDIFLLLTTINASIHVATNITEQIILTPPEFLKYPMHKSVIIKVTLPTIEKESTYFETYKITPRMQNAHAYVNAGFLVHISRNCVSSANLCFGGINPQFIQAKATAESLKGKIWINNSTFQQAMTVLSAELRPDWNLPDASPDFRHLLACGLFYKFILKTAPSNMIAPKLRSGGTLIFRPLSSGSQFYSTKPKNYPLTKPIVKLDAMHQTSGEAQYMNDLPPMHGELWAAFVHAQETNATVAQIDPTEALKIPGVVAFYSAKDIPGRNSYVAIGLFAIEEDEEIFCNGRVKYHSQPVGVIIAENLDIARKASKKVRVVYEHVGREVNCTMKSILNQRCAKDNDSTLAELTESLDLANVVKGHFEIGGQYHFSMETQTAICVPDEDELNVFSSTHYIDLVHTAMANALKIPQNKVNFVVRRLGGSYGAKLSRSGHVAISCALAATKLNRPVRFVQSLESNMATVGKRFACYNDYNVTVNNKGLIQQLTIRFFEDFGCSKNDNPINLFTIPFIPNCYTNNGWVINGEVVVTDAPSHTWCRAPGSLEGIAMIENIIEHIARKVSLDPVDVRLGNIPTGSKMSKLLPEFITSTSYRDRKKTINKFNRENRWKKKGIAISVMKYPIQYFGTFPATVIVYHYDATVIISHGGIEVGQGLNTKVAQVAAHILGIPLEMVRVKPTTAVNGANSAVTGGSIGSESVCAAVRGACEIILDRLKPLRSKEPKATWKDIIAMAHLQNISLIGNYLYKAGDLQRYDIWGLSCTEVEVDILTGNVQLTRVDILEDTGESLSPLIDCGQVEGAFIMGVGYWLTEELIYDRRNGKLLTNRTWNYKVPGAKDIPVDFRITLYQKDANQNGFLRSKATGEPAICLSISTIFAVRHALDSARNDANVKSWYPLGAPTTPEHVLLSAGHGTSQFRLQ